MCLLALLLSGSSPRLQLFMPLAPLALQRLRLGTTLSARRLRPHAGTRAHPLQVGLEDTALLRLRFQLLGESAAPRSGLVRLGAEAQTTCENTPATGVSSLARSPQQYGLLLGLLE